MGLFSKLKQRRLFRIVGSAVAGGWILLEATSSFVERGLLPEVAYRVGLVWYVGGILGAAVIGWHHGEKGRQRVQAGEAVTLVALAGLVILGSFFTVSASGAPEADAGPGPVAEAELHADRIAVAPLQNKTMDASYDALGSMASDWITEGLHRTGLVEVVPSPMAIQAARFVEGATAEDPTMDPLRAMGEETGARTVVSGSYYLIGDSIQFQLQVTDVASGRLVGAPEPVTVPADRPAPGLSEIRSRVMGALAVGFDERLAGHAGEQDAPPDYEAYQEFSRGLEAYTDWRWGESVEHFQRARELDPDFALPLLYEAFSRSNLGQNAEADSVVDVLAESASQLSEYDRSWLRYMQAQFRLDRAGALRAIREAAEIAPGSKASYNAAWLALINNRPREALSWLARLAPERGPMRGWYTYWVLRADAHHRLDEHEQELEVAREARRRYPERLGSLRLEIDALIGLGRIDEAKELIEQIRVQPGTDFTPCWAYNGIAPVFDAHGHREEADASYRECAEWSEHALAGDPEAPEILSQRATALQELGRYGEALGAVERLVDLRGEQAAYRGWEAVLRAHLGEWEEAREVLASLDTVEAPYQRPAIVLQRARVAAITGERDRAVELYRRAIQEGLPVPRHPDRSFDRMRDHPPLLELFRPRG